MLANLNANHQDINIIEKINNESFPSQERLDIEGMLLLAEKDEGELLGIYDNKNLVGFALTIKNRSYTYVWYFAIDKIQRSKGYGSQAIQLIIKRYKNTQVLLDFEEIDENAENIHQRKRRKNFYLRNGFFETGLFTMSNGNRYELVSNERNLNEVEFIKILQIINSYYSKFQPRLI